MEAHAASSPLVTARLRRRLTLEEAAELTSLEVDDIKSLEESRTYRFPSTTDAIAAIVVYASVLGITEREARELAGPARHLGGRALVAPALGDHRRLRGGGRRLPRLRPAAAGLSRRRAHPAGRPRDDSGGRGAAAAGALGDPGRRLQRHPPRERRFGPRQRDRRPRLRDRRGQERRPEELHGDSGLLPAGRRGRGAAPRGASSASARPRSRAATTRTGSSSSSAPRARPASRRAAFAARRASPSARATSPPGSRPGARSVLRLASKR